MLGALKMKQILIKEELINKTIKTTGYSDNMFVVFFTDETYSIFRGCGWDSTDVELMDNEYSLNPTRYNLLELKEIGIISKDEYIKLANKFDVKQKRKNKKRERIKRIFKLKI